MNGKIVRFVLLLALIGAPADWLLGSSPMSQSAPAAAPASEMAQSDSGGGASLAYDGSANLSSGIERKVIGRASLSLVVADTDTASAAIQTLVEQAGGFVSNANFYKSSPSTGSALAGSMTLRCPAEGLDKLLADLEGLALSVESRNLSRRM